MAKAKLSPNEVLRIVHLLETWEEALTWEDLVARVPRTIGRAFTSQTLRRHAAIAIAFAQAKSRGQAIRILMKTRLDNPKRLLLDLAGDAAPISKPEKPASRRASR